MTKVAMILLGLIGGVQAFAYGGPATIQQALKDSFAVAVGWEHTCVLDERNTVDCWGSNEFGQLNMPTLNKPVQIATGAKHSCVIDSGAVRCWGDNEFGQASAPALVNPKEVVAGEHHSCAIDNYGVQCWGTNFNGQASVPAIQNPRQLVAGAFFNCAIGDDGVDCWGHTNVGQLNVPHLINPKQLAAGQYHACALDETGVKCWDAARDQEIIMAPKLSHPRQISAGTGFSCALDDDGVKCWGREAFGRTNVPKLEHPRQIASGANASCAVHDSGVRCWAGAYATPKRFSGVNFKLVSFYIDTLENSYSKMSRYVYRGKKTILENLSKAIAKLPVSGSGSLDDSNGKARLFSLYAIEPLMVDTTSAIVTQSVLPHLISAKTEWSQKFGIASIDDISLSDEIISVSFTLLESSLTAAKSGLAQSSRKDLEDLILKIAQIKASAGQDHAVTVSALVTVLDQYQGLFATLVQDESTSGFGKTILLLQNYLRTQLNKQ